MKTVNNTFGVIFYLRKYKATNDGKAPIYARITVNGSRIDISVKRTIETGNWNEGKGMAKGSREDITRLNNYLEQSRAGIVESYQQLLIQKTHHRRTLKRKSYGWRSGRFYALQMMHYHNTDQAQVLEPGTMKNYYTTKNMSKSF